MGARPPARAANGSAITRRPPCDWRRRTRARLTTLSLLLAQPISRVIDHAIEAYVQHLPESEQKILGPLVERLAHGDWPVTSHWAVQWERLEKSRAKAPRAADKPRARR